MPYFVDHYHEVSFPIKTEAEPGFRNAQIGAIHAIASYFTLHSEPMRADPALVVMPTGSGKTAVLLTSAFVLRPKQRVLIVTPSRAVRNQMENEARTLTTLRQIGALPDDIEKPRVHEVTERLATPTHWEDLTDFDVVVGTPNSVSPGTRGVSEPPASPTNPFFDLVLMDEAHHSPARTWKALLAAFPGAKKVLCTATPFRRDEREIRAQMVYEYPLGRALRDGIICRLNYMPVEVRRGEDLDMALARKAKVVLRAEQRKNPSYRLLVRTDRKVHADKLEEIYAAKPIKLKLRTVHSRHSPKHIDRSIRMLRAGELDGLLCVDMLGEGFDFPPLKVAAVHRKHKTLPVTLQFIGRFGRVTQEGKITKKEERAHILAVPEELEGQIERLYEENRAWAEVIPNLQDHIIIENRKIRRDLETFKVVKDLPEKLEGISLWGLEPLAHVKIYEVEPGVRVNIDREIELSLPFKVVYCAVSRELSAAVFIAQEVRKPSWANVDVNLFDRVECDLFVVYCNHSANLLFISASRRNSIALYEEIAKQYTGQGDSEGEKAHHHILPLYKINRILRGFSGANCFNLGMRNRQTSLVNEAYRILAGPEVERAVKHSDGQLYHRGHVMVGLEDPKEERTVTLGYSSSSKVWQGKYLRVPQLVEWCRGLAAKISDEGPVDSNENLRILHVGEPLTELPKNLMAATWDDEVYMRSLRLVYGDDTAEDGTGRQELNLFEAVWIVDRRSATSRSVRLVLDARGKHWPLLFSLDTPLLFTAHGEGNLPQVHTAREVMALLDYLNASPLHIFTADFSRLHGLEIFRAPQESVTFDLSCFRPIDWLTRGVHLDREFGWTGKNHTRDGFDKASIHGELAELLRKEKKFPVILYDHGSGEIADFITWEETRQGETAWWSDKKEVRDAVRVYLFHVKGAKKSKKQAETRPGNRVGDAYEVCGQVVKSLIWVSRRRRLAEHLRDRCQKNSFFLRGNLSTARRLLTERQRPVYFHVGLVQPGITAQGAEQKILKILAAADDYVRNAVGNPVFVLCSP